MPKLIANANECRILIDRAIAYLPQPDYDTFKRVESEMIYRA